MSGNASTHVWVVDTTKPLGGYWKRALGGSSGETIVNTAYPTPMTTTVRDALVATTIGYGYSIYNTTTNQEEVYIGDSVTNVAADWRAGQKVTVTGASHVALKNGTGQPTKNRNMAAANPTYAATSNSVTFTSTDNVTEVVITAMSSTAAAVQNDEYILVVFDATSEAVAAAWLADAGGVSSDVEYHFIPVGVPTRMCFASYLSRIDVDPQNDTMRVIVEAQ